jgi:hypothetical protein
LTEQTGNAKQFAGDSPPNHVLKVRVARGDDALMVQVLQHLAQNEYRLRRKHRHTLRLPFKFRLGGGAEPVVEEFENDPLLLQTGRLAREDETRNSIR